MSRELPPIKIQFVQEDHVVATVAGSDALVQALAKEEPPGDVVVRWERKSDGRVVATLPLHR